MFSTFVIKIFNIFWELWGEEEMTNVTGNVMLLQQQIEIKRKQMFDYAATYGINSTLTLQCSQELDILLNRLDYKLYHKQTA